MPYLGRSSNFGVRSVFHYLPSAGDTSVSGADADGKTLARKCGYATVQKNGSEKILMTSFYEAILIAKGITD